MVERACFMARKTTAKYSNQKQIRECYTFPEGQEVTRLVLSCLSPPPLLTPRTSHSVSVGTQQLLPSLAIPLQRRARGFHQRLPGSLSRRKRLPRCQGLSMLPQCQLSVYNRKFTTLTKAKSGICLSLQKEFHKQFCNQKIKLSFPRLYFFYFPKIQQHCL